MGKNAVKNQKKKMAKARKKMAAKLNIDSLTLSELLTKAQECIDSYQFEKAQKYCQEALRRDPDHVVALETSAGLCLEVGNLEGAKHCFGRAITLQPEEGYSKYLSMAQLLEGKDALQCYLKGIELIQSALSKLEMSPTSETTVDDKEKEKVNDENDMEMIATEKETKESEDKVDERENEPPPVASTASSSILQDDPKSLRCTIIRQMSSAYCSIAELFMTDLCDEEDAEAQCHSSINKAIEVDASNPEAYQNMASFLLVKQENDQAKQFITKSLELWLPKFKAVEKGEAAAGTFDPVEVCPLSYGTRLSAARILIEVEDHDHAVDVLEGLAEEDDSVVDTWYLMGWSSYLRGEEHKDNARYLLHRAMQVHGVTPSSDAQLVEHLEELLEELGPLPEDQVPNEDDIIKELEDSDDDDDDNGDEEDMDTT